MNQILNLSGALSVAQGTVTGIMWIIILGLLVTKLVKFKLKSVAMLFVGGAVLSYFIYHYTVLSTIVSKIIELFT
jgi:uncharacterized membrane protein